MKSNWLHTYLHTYGTSCVIDIVVENEHSDSSSKPGRGSFCISPSVKTILKGMNLNIPTPALDK